MKKFLFIICAVLIILPAFVISSCTQEIKNISTDTTLSDGSTGALANNKAVDFYFYYPENCVLIKNDAMIMVYVPDSKVVQSTTAQNSADSTGSSGSVSETQTVPAASFDGVAFPVGPNLSATVFGLPEGKYSDAMDYWNNYALPGYEIIYQNIQFDPAEPEDVTLDGISGKKYTFTAGMAGIPLKISQVVFFNRNQVYSLIYTSTPDKFDQYANILTTAVETFKFK